MNATVGKSAVEIEGEFVLDVKVVLGRELDRVADRVRVVLPSSERYDLAGVQCVSAGVEMACVKKYEDFTNNLVI